jgi:hypothetical protein
MVDADTGSAGTVVQRVAAIVLLLVAGIFSLPVSALFLDGEGTENWILPAQLAGMLLIGAAVGSLLPGLAGADSSRGRAARVGAATGVGMAVVGFVLFFVLINGFDVT